MIPQAQANILIAVDGSDQSFEVVRYVGRIIPPGRAGFTLLHIAHEIPESFWDTEQDPRPGQDEIWVESVAAPQRRVIDVFLDKTRQELHLLGHQDDLVTALVKKRQAGVARDIIKEARQGYQALVLGRRGSSRLPDLVFGSVATKLLDCLTDVALWVVGGSPDPGKLLAAMDASESAIRLVDYVGQVFEESLPELILFHVIRDFRMTLPDAARDGLNDDAKELTSLAGEQAKRAAAAMVPLLQQGVKALRDRGGRLEDILAKIITGEPSRSGAIIREARQGGYGTVVLGRKGVSRVAEFPFGRVSQKVIQMADDLAVWVIN
ncbi:MAG: universal stress protein [Deltaproteobacteria bacterium]|nr:universal stress protein [Deltaproteobacteria bacterium]